MTTGPEIILPTDENHWLSLRAQDITSTEVAALFGCSPYLTKFELWHRKKDRTVITLEPSERMRWGTRLQDSIAQGIAEDQGWRVRRMAEYIRNSELRIGASFDFGILETVDFPGINFKDEQPIGLLEIKNVDSLAFRDGWIIDGDTLEAPPHIELQVQHQLLVSGLSTAYIGALIGGNRVVLIKRESDSNVHYAIKNAVAEFWKSIEENNPPPPIFPQDSQAVSKLYGYAEPGKVLHADQAIDSLCADYKTYANAEKESREKKESVRAQILMKIGDAEKVTGANFTISAGVIGPAQIPAHERKGYRNFKLNWKKEKQ